MCMVKALDLRFLKKKNSNTKNHLNLKFHGNIHRVVLNFNLKTTWCRGFCIHHAKYLENYYDHTFIRLSSGYN